MTPTRHPARREEIRQVYDMRLHLATLVGSFESGGVSGLQKSQARSLLLQAVTLVDNFDQRNYVLLNCQLNNIVLRSFWRQTYYQAVGYIQRVHIGYGYQRIKAHLFQPSESSGKRFTEPFSDPPYT
jgi:hypothetical protein